VENGKFFEMKEIWEKYRAFVLIMAAVAVLYSATVAHYRHRVADLKRELLDKDVERIMDVDNVLSDILGRKAREIDSLVRTERLRYDSLLIQFEKTKKSYEKIRADYSDIVIDRPEF
jgi:hypothetical protein